MDRDTKAALHRASMGAERAGLAWNDVLTSMRHIEQASLHADLIEAAWALSAQLGDLRAALTHASEHPR